MTGRFELVDSHHPEWKGQRFSSLARAIKEWEQSVPPGRFWIKDRTTGKPPEYGDLR